MTAVITSAMGGQPGTLMIGLLAMPGTLCTGVARVGFGRAACTQPQEAQEPQEMMALQCSAAARWRSRWLRPLQRLAVP